MVNSGKLPKAYRKLCMIKEESYMTSVSNKKTVQVGISAIERFKDIVGASRLKFRFITYRILQSSQRNHTPVCPTSFCFRCRHHFLQRRLKTGGIFTSKHRRFFDRFCHYSFSLSLQFVDKYSTFSAKLFFFRRKFCGLEFKLVRV